MEYKYLKDLTSDVAFNAYGNTFEETLSNSGKALLNIMCEIKKVKNKEIREITVKGNNNKEILFNFLQSLIVEVEIEQMFFCDFKINIIKKKEIKVICYGEEINPRIQRTHVKALTNYLFNLQEKNKKNNQYIATVSVDI
ncbi:MAG: archease [Candidatus Woesearchaeota archaeon]